MLKVLQNFLCIKCLLFSLPSPFRRFQAICLLLFCLTEYKSQVIYNAYAQVTLVSSGTLLSVSNVTETNHTFAAGEQVVVMQMQDDVIGTNTANTTSFGALGSIANAGVYEIATVLAVNRSAGTPTTIALSAPLANTYNTGSNSRVQLITFRRLSSSAFTTTNIIQGVSWDGTRGGVIALNVGGDFTINHWINADGLGFRGGTVSANYYGGGTTCSSITPAGSSTNHGGKGEGIYAVTSATHATGMAKILNGGGGGGQDINGGGGGGGNYTAGGAGGIGWGCTTGNNASGQGGITLSVSISSNRVFMGGGGGGGQQNNSSSSVGARGGGIILIKANRILTAGCATSPSITARGNNSANAGNDGAGGAGAGGSIVLEVPTYSVNAGCPLRVDASGGRGGNVTDASQHAGGGAGGQGVIIYSIAQPTLNIVTAANNGTPGCNNAGCTSSAGVAGGANNNGIVTLANVILPIRLQSFNGYTVNEGVKLEWSTASEKNTDYYSVEKSSDGNHWLSFDRIKAKGQSATLQNYSSYDYNPPAGLVYYRLIAMDYDLQFQQSPVIAIQVTKAASELLLYPNPSHNDVTISLSGNVLPNTFVLSDARGNTLPLPLLWQSDTQFKADIRHLPPGLYFLQVKTENGRLWSKFIVE